MARVPYRRPCKTGCGYPAAKGRQFCHWHVLMRSSTDVQAQAAQRRRADAESQASYEYASRVPKADWPEGERWCAGCQSFVPLFYCSGSKCKGCARQAAHEARVEKVYGINVVEYERIYDAQGRVCGICGATARTIRFAVDHDHKTGEVRGILCKRCNHDFLGSGHDTVLGLWKGLAYLLDPPAQRGREAPMSRDHLLVTLKAHLDLEEYKPRYVTTLAGLPVEPPY